MLDQLSGEVCKLERMAAAGNGDHNDTRNETKRDEQNPNERIDDQPLKGPESAVHVGDEDAHERPRVKGERQEFRGASKGRDDLRDAPPCAHGQNQGDDAEGPPEDDSGRRHASVPACSQAGMCSEPLDDHTNMEPELPPGATGEQLSPPEQVALQRPAAKSPAGKVNNQEPATGEGAQLRFELRDARSLAEKFRGELSAAQKM